MLVAPLGIVIVGLIFAIIGVVVVLGAAYLVAVARR